MLLLSRNWTLSYNITWGKEKTVTQIRCQVCLWKAIEAYSKTDKKELIIIYLDSKMSNWTISFFPRPDEYQAKTRCRVVCRVLQLVLMSGKLWTTGFAVVQYLDWRWTQECSKTSSIIFTISFIPDLTIDQWQQPFKIPQFSASVPPFPFFFLWLSASSLTIALHVCGTIENKRVPYIVCVASKPNQGSQFFCCRSSVDVRCWFAWCAVKSQQL